MCVYKTTALADSEARLVVYTFLIRHGSSSTLRDVVLQSCTLLLPNLGFMHSWFYLNVFKLQRLCVQARIIILLLKGIVTAYLLQVGNGDVQLSLL